MDKFRDFVSSASQYAKDKLYQKNTSIKHLKPQEFIKKNDNSMLKWSTSKINDAAKQIQIIQQNALETSKNIQNTAIEKLRDSQQKVVNTSMNVRNITTDQLKKSQQTLVNTSMSIKNTASEQFRNSQKKIMDTPAYIRKSVTTLGSNIRQNANEQLQITSNAVKSRIADNSASVRKKSIENATMMKEKLQSSKEKLSDSLYSSTSKLTERLPSFKFEDPRVTGRRFRNRLIGLGILCIFTYGFATSLPDAMSRYALEKKRIEMEKHHK